MKDDLDGVDLRLKEGVDSVQVAKVAAAILNSTHHNIQDFTRHHPRRACWRSRNGRRQFLLMSWWLSPQFRFL